ncbi:glycosyltransferase [Cyclobacterium plantarum]|uniref:Glycosyltransferase n=1 Tax=Cyclobacterium plantarum TaxID=2716263 RepID=A0ABX0H734_9BACT|nr:glycosyltransferase [Cyclobacterium plantarum]NHE56237.1 glycosyltransferase [Cyclobacterium plantarum]
MKKIRLLHCIETISSGGVERVRLTYANQMDKEIYELKIVCTQAKGKILSELNRLGVEVISIGTFAHPMEVRKYRVLLKVIREFRPHIIHGAVFEGNSMAFVGKVIGRVPIAILEETSDPITRSKRANRLLSFYSRFAEAVIGISPAVMDYLIKLVNVKASKLTLIPNGLDIPGKADLEASKLLKDKLGINDDDVVVGAVGRVYNRVKGFSDIIDALHFLNIPTLKFLLVGNGPDLEMLKATVRKLGLEARVHFVGYQEDPNPFYSIMDIFCVPSHQEGFGLVAVEAMLHRLPVIGSRVGGLKDIVVDGVSGFLVPPACFQELASKMKVLFESPELRKEFGENGYKIGIENYSSDLYFKNLDDLYQRLLREKGII